MPTIEVTVTHKGGGRPALIDSIATAVDMAMMMNGARAGKGDYVVEVSWGRDARKVEADDDDREVPR